MELRRHPARGPRAPPVALRGHLLAVPHRRPRARPGTDAPRRGRGHLAPPSPHEPAGRHLGQRRRSPTTGLRALGVPQASLDSFAWEFRQGMAARADRAGRHRRQRPGALGSSRSGTRTSTSCWSRSRPTRQRLEAAVEPGPARVSSDCAGIDRDLAAGLPRPAHRDGALRLPRRHQPSGRSKAAASPAPTRWSRRSRPASSCSATPTRWAAFRPPRPDVLGRNGSYVAFRKLHQAWPRSAASCRTTPTEPDEEELLAAKMMGRWRSGAPLALCPMHDDPALGADRARNNAFLFRADDPAGLQHPRRHRTSAAPTRATRPWPAWPASTA